jgi:hypothetical protein
MSPRSGRSGMSRSPPMELRSLPQSIRNSTLLPNPSIFEGTASGSGSEQYHGGDENSSDTQSNWGGPFPISATTRYPNSVFPASRRETTGTLPAYTLDDEGDTPPASAIRTRAENTFDSAISEKLQLQMAYSGCTTPQSEAASPTTPIAGPSRPPTQAQNRMTHKSNSESITSVFASPPSLWRQSIPPTPLPPPHTSLPRPPSRYNLSRKPVPSVPTSPRIAETVYEGSPESTKVQPKSSISPEEMLAILPVPPPSAFQLLQGDRDLSPGTGGKHSRNRSLGGVSHKTNASAARPDSDVIPFEDFVTSLDHAELSELSQSGSSKAEDDIFGPRK